MKMPEPSIKECIAGKTITGYTAEQMKQYGRDLSENGLLRVNPNSKHPAIRQNRAMTYELAMKILDQVRDGWSYPAHIVNQALEMTGDL